jgi:dTDP-glucose 4,6-dehydratase
LARTKGARYLLASTSEVYGDPLVHPQVETYWGNVNPVGPRSVYDEAKRFAEALTMAYRRQTGLDTKIVRIFNTYGPRLRPGDGRVVSNFIVQALTGTPITVYGDGSQTRSFCYADDEIRGVLALLDSDWTGGPINIGNPDEYAVKDLAQIVQQVSGANFSLVYAPLPVDDPVRRRPNIELAQRILGWSPETALYDGIAQTVEWFRSKLGGRHPK